MQRSNRVEIVADEVSQGERQYCMGFVVRAGWNPFQPLTNASLAYYVTVVHLSFFICEYGNNNTQRYILRIMHVPN